MSSVKKLLRKYNDIPLVAKATIWFVFCSSLQKCVSLITTPIFTRIMTTEQYGQFGIYNSWLQIFTIITTFRLNYAVFNKGMSKYKDDRDSYTSTMQIITLVLATSTLLIYLPIKKYINQLLELPTFIVVAMFVELMFFPAVDFWTLKKRYEYIYRPVVVRTIVMVVLNALIGVIAVVLSEEKGYARILTAVGVNLAFGILLFVNNAKSAKKLFVWEYAKFSIMFNLPLILHYMSQYVLDQFDRIMIQKMVGIGAVGIYTVAYNAGLVVKTVTNSINTALVPWHYDKLEKRDFKAMDNALFPVFALIAVITLMFSAFAPEIMWLLADKQYYEAIYVIPPIALSMYFLFIYSVFTNVEFFYDANQFTMYISVAGAVVDVVLNYFFIKWFGYIAAAYTTLLCYILFSIGHYIYMQRIVKHRLGVKEFFSTKRILYLSLGLLCLGVLVIFLYDKIILRYILILIGLSICIYKRKQIYAAIRSIKK